MGVNCGSPKPSPYPQCIARFLQLAVSRRRFPHIECTDNQKQTVSVEDRTVTVLSLKGPPGMEAEAARPTTGCLSWLLGLHQNDLEMRLPAAKAPAQARLTHAQGGEPGKGGCKKYVFNKHFRVLTRHQVFFKTP